MRRDEVDELRQRVMKLEELLTHQEHLLQQFHEVTLRLREDQDKLSKSVSRQLGHLEARLEERATPLDPNEKPPHY